MGPLQLRRRRRCQDDSLGRNPAAGVRRFVGAKQRNEPFDTFQARAALHRTHRPEWRVDEQHAATPHAQCPKLGSHLLDALLRHHVIPGQTPSRESFS